MDGGKYLPTYDPGKFWGNLWNGVKSVGSGIGNVLSQEGDTLLGITSRIPGLINERSIIGEKGDIPRISVSNKYAPAAL